MKKNWLATSAFASAALVALAPVLAQAEIKTSVYGFIKADYYGTSNQFNSDYKPTAVSTTAGAPLAEASRGQLSMKQSRFGINVDNESRVKLKFEFDLDGAGAAANTVGVMSSDTGFFRVRLANLTYKVSDEGTLTIGKKWDIFSPLQPHSYQMTTIQFWSGNTGFLTDGIDYTHKMENVTLAAEVKNAGGNPATAADNTTVKLSLPIATVRGDVTFSDQTLGVSYMAGKLNYSRQDQTAPYVEDAMISAVNLYWHGVFGATDVVAEVHQGSNVGAGVVGGLGGVLTPATVATTTPSFTNEELGYYASAKHQFEGWSLFGGYGRVDFAEKNNAPTNSFQGLVSNETIRLGADMDLDAGVKLFVEAAHMTSSYLEGGDTRGYSGTWYNAGLLARF